MMSGNSLRVHRPFDEICIVCCHIVMPLVLFSRFATVYGSYSWYKHANWFCWMSMGAQLLANTSAASHEMARKALIMRIAETLCTAFIRLANDIVSSADFMCPIGAAYSITVLIALTIKNRRLKYTQPIFANILDKEF